MIDMAIFHIVGIAVHADRIIPSVALKGFPGIFSKVKEATVGTCTTVVPRGPRIVVL